MAISYFKNLLKYSLPGDFSELFQGFKPRLAARNDQLLKAVSREEVKEAVFAIKAHSAPGADGMTGLFFQRFWEVIGDLVTAEVQSFFEVGFFPSD